jgi:hypothetical protein
MVSLPSINFHFSIPLTAVQRCQLELVDYSKLLGDSAGSGRIHTLTLKRSDFTMPWGMHVSFLPNGVIVSHIDESSPAAASHSLHVGDEVLSINSISLSCLSDQEAAKLLALAQPELLLSVLSEPPSHLHDKDTDASRTHVDLRLIELKIPRGAETAGFRLSGYSNSTKVLQRTGLYVTDVTTSAFEAGLRDGDQLIEISGRTGGDWLSVRLESVELVSDRLEQLVSEASGESLWIVVLPTRQPRRLIPLLSHSNSETAVDTVAVQVALRAQEMLNPRGSTDSGPATTPDLAESAHAHVVPAQVNNIAAPAPGEPCLTAMLTAPPFFVRAYHESTALPVGQYCWLVTRRRDVLEVLDISHPDYWIARHPARPALPTGGPGDSLSSSSTTARSMLPPSEPGLIPSRAFLARLIAEQAPPSQIAGLPTSGTSGVTIGPASDAFFATSTTTASPFPAMYSPVAKRVHSSSTPHTYVPRPVGVVGAESARASKVLQLLPGALTKFPLQHAVPHTTRPRRDGEMNGRDYFFVSQAEFEELLQRQLFMEAGYYKVRAWCPV